MVFSPIKSTLANKLMVAFSFIPTLVALLTIVLRLQKYYTMIAIKTQVLV